MMSHLSSLKSWYTAIIISFHPFQLFCLSFTVFYYKQNPYSELNQLSSSLGLYFNTRGPVYEITWDWDCFPRATPGLAGWSHGPAYMRVEPYDPRPHCEEPQGPTPPCVSEQLFGQDAIRASRHGVSTTGLL